MPAAPAVLRLHLVHLAAKGRSVSVIKVARAAVCQAHAVLGYPRPAPGPLQAALRSVLRKVGDVQPRRPPLRVEHLRALVLTCKNDPVGARDRAVLLVTHHARMRRAEITRLDLKDVFFDEAGLVFRVGPDILGAAAQPVGLLCPVRALEEWLPIRARCAHDTGPLFVTLPRAGEAFGTRMTCKDVYRMVRRRAQLAGLESLNLACERDQRRRVCAL
jgi:integrase